MESFSHQHVFPVAGSLQRKRTEKERRRRKTAGSAQPESAGDGPGEKVERKTEKKNPPLLYNLAELQNDGSRFLKISPDETLRIVQELYEKKLVTYPRTDARVLSTAVAKVIARNLKGLCPYPQGGVFAARILEEERYKGISKTRYVNDSQITDRIIAFFCQ